MYRIVCITDFHTVLLRKGAHFLISRYVFKKLCQKHVLISV